MSVYPELSCPPTRTQLSAHPDFLMSAGIIAKQLRAVSDGGGFRSPFVGDSAVTSTDTNLASATS
jgi:hypothetical protein